MLQCRSTSQVTEEMPCMSKRSPSVAKDDLPVTNYPFNAGARGDSAGAASGSAYGQIIRATQVPHTTPCQAYFPLALGFNKLYNTGTTDHLYHFSRRSYVKEAYREACSQHFHNQRHAITPAALYYLPSKSVACGDILHLKEQIMAFKILLW
jgi:hypothetical protein